MKQYIEEVDALQASETLRQSIADLPRQAAKKKPNGRRFAAIAAVIAVVLIAGIIGVPSVFLATRKAGSSADYMAADQKSYAVAENDYAYGETYEMPEEAVFTSQTAKPAGMPTELPAGRKFIRDADLSVETKEYDTFLSSVSEHLSALGGYVQSTESNAYYSGNRYSTLIFRVPADKLDTFLEQVSALGTVTSQSTSVKDVTDDYIDLDSRVKALETEQATLLSLLEKADSLADALEIQNRLSEVRASLESYKGKLKALEGQIDYSNVTIRLEEVERVTPPEGKTFFQQVRANLTENLYSIGQGFRSFGITFLSGLPYILLWLFFIGIIVLIVVLIVRKRRRSRR